MFRECRHTMPAGVHCQSPAMGNSAYCCHHDRLHRRLAQAYRARKFMQLPQLASREALLDGLTDVMNGILARKIDFRQAGRLMFLYKPLPAASAKRPIPKTPIRQIPR